MASGKDLPENIRQAVDLISAVIRRIHEKTLTVDPHSCLYHNKAERANS